MSSLSIGFYEAVREGDLDMVQNFLRNDITVLSTRFSKFEANALQVAVVCGQEKIFGALMKEVDSHNHLLKEKNKFGETILTLAAAQGSMKIVTQLVERCHELVNIPNGNGELPITVAALFGKREIVTFLFDWTLAIYLFNPSCRDVEEDGDVINSTRSTGDDDDFRVLKLSMTTQVRGHDERNFSFSLVNEDKDQAKPAYQSKHHSFRLFKACIRSQIYDIASEVFKQFPMVCINEMAEEDGETMNSLAMASIELPKRRNFVPRIHESCLKKLGNSCMPWSRFVKSLYENYYEEPKRARMLLRRICTKILKSSSPEKIIERVLIRPILTAAKHENAGFIVAVTYLCPDVIWLIVDKISKFSDSSSPFSPGLSKDLLQIHISTMKNSKTGLLSTIQADRNGNTILHHAAMLSSAKTLSRFPNPYLQMQREIHWFKKAEKIVPMCKRIENNDNLTPIDLFEQEHRKLKKAREKWLKETASSCLIVATLIISITFTASFTVPGGYDNSTGSPVNFGSKYFAVFIISDAFSLFLSCASAMIFLAIYTLGFIGENLLPLALTCGIFALFASIEAMAIAFSAALILTVSERFVWVALPLLMLASIPVIIFFISHVWIFIQVLRSTLHHQLSR